MAVEQEDKVFASIKTKEEISHQNEILMDATSRHLTSIELLLLRTNFHFVNPSPSHSNDGWKKD